MSEDRLYFATSGIRGKTGTEINSDLALRVGKAVGNMILSFKFNNPKAYVGYDNRKNSKILAYTLAGGLTSVGIDVFLPKVPVPTPMLIHATIANQANAGVIITGSHLPAEDNGIILVDGLGNYYKGWMDLSPLSDVGWGELGNQYEFTTEIEEYIKFLNDYASKQQFSSFPHKLLLDPVHGPMREYLHRSMKNVGAELVLLNFEDDIAFSGRISEPTPNNLRITAQKVVDSSSELGIATDMDGDRVIYLLEDGEVISGDYIGALFAKWLWETNPQGKVVIPINTSAIINYVAEEMNAEFVYCKVGPPSIIAQIRADNAILGFEETGKYIFPETAIWPDSVISTIFLLSNLKKRKTTLKQELRKFPRLYSKKIKVPCSRMKSPKVMTIIESELVNELEDISQIETMDGLRINFSDKSWLLIRPSGTEDYIRVFSEHSNRDNNEQLNQMGENIVKKGLQRITEADNQ